MNRRRLLVVAIPSIAGVFGGCLDQVLDTNDGDVELRDVSYSAVEGTYRTGTEFIGFIYNGRDEPIEGAQVTVTVTADDVILDQAAYSTITEIHSDTSIEFTVGIEPTPDEWDDYQIDLEPDRYAGPDG